MTDWVIGEPGVEKIGDIGRDARTQAEVVKRGAVTLALEQELVERLKRGRPLRVKYGLDPTAPDIHLGHTVGFRKLRQFQELGHHVVIIVGDYTALVGDPSGVVKTRPRLSPEEVEAHGRTYLDQMGKVIDLKKNIEVRKNSEWLSTLALSRLIELASRFTLARLKERDDFQKRLQAGQPVGLHELLYPLLQSIDSVEVKADVEIGGNDQTFNFMMTRDFMRDMGLEPQIVLTMPLLRGTDGEEKMSKSKGNYIGVNEAPVEMYSKTMSIPDALMRDYFTLLTDLPLQEVDGLMSGHPMTAKKRLAREIVDAYHPGGAADDAAARWDAVMSKKEVPADVPSLEVPRSDLKDGKIWIVQLVAMTKIPATNSEARRLIAQGGVEVDNVRVTDINAMVGVAEGNLLKIGKKNRYFRLTMKG